MSMNGKHILVMAGGTGGHVFPALAVAKQIVDLGGKVTWLGTQRGIEARLVPENGFNIEFITVEGMRGKSKLSLIGAPFKVVKAMAQASSVIDRIRPNAVLGFGGFVAGPGGVMARFHKLPLIIHEQNSVAGLTNKWLSKIAAKTLTGFPNVMDLPTGSIWVGNPVRAEMVPKDTGRRRRIRVLILGGSQGAHTLNMVLPKLFADLDTQIKIKHQAGKEKSKGVSALYNTHGVEAKVVDFIDDMASAYQWADFLICRAGAMTVTECCAVGKPAILVPYPFSAGDHQIHNAQTMVDAGAAEMILNHKLDSRNSLTIIQKFCSDRARLQHMGENARVLHKEGATSSVVDVLQEVLNEE